MYKANLIAFLALAITVAVASKIEGTAVLKDSQPTGTTDKTHKNQQYDLSFEASGKQYTCRTLEKKSMKATDFIVGADIRYSIGGNKGKLKNTTGKEVECTIVRVAALSNPQQ
jgi:hypothetical protein